MRLILFMFILTGCSNKFDSHVCDSDNHCRLGCKDVIINVK